jgi:class 3 adenylate cyclase
MSWTGRQPTCGACRASIGDDDRFCRRCGAVVSGADQAEPAARKSVTILFIDLVDSTTLAERLDPEVLGKVLGQYYQACASCIASHGGMIEKYIGDAVMAVFGVPISTRQCVRSASLRFPGGS